MNKIRYQTEPFLHVNGNADKQFFLFFLLWKYRRTILWKKKKEKKKSNKKQKQKQNKILWNRICCMRY